MGSSRSGSRRQVSSVEVADNSIPPQVTVSFNLQPPPLQQNIDLVDLRESKRVRTQIYDVDNSSIQSSQNEVVDDLSEQPPLPSLPPPLPLIQAAAPPQIPAAELNGGK